jgi:hypothetical protein
VTLTREPVILLYQNINKSKELKRSFGHWQEETFDKDKQCRIPVLGLKEFEEHLGKFDGGLSVKENATQIGLVLMSLP